MKRQNPVIEQVGRGDRSLGGVQVDLRDLAISIYIGLLMNAPNTLEGANREGVLRSQIAGMGRLDLAAGCIIQLFLFQGLDLCLGQDTTFFGDFGLQRLQAVLTFVRSWRSQINRTPEGGTNTPSLCNSLEVLA